MKKKYTKYEKARIIGARALQLAMGAPLLIKKSKSIVSVIDLARKEFESEVLPITVNRPKPTKSVIE
ncbi:MAG: DNA-directed RNA polymerase subunit K [Candidatus Woesearchaeota archaeon]|nr:MAG: DNA-directed RNA polymerase subunit K [Candidatus Woesearchaeota archaeon]